MVAVGMISARQCYRRRAQRGAVTLERDRASNHFYRLKFEFLIGMMKSAVSILRDRLMAGPMPLEHGILVRIQVPQPWVCLLNKIRTFYQNNPSED